MSNSDLSGGFFSGYQQSYPQASWITLYSY